MTRAVRKMWSAAGVVSGFRGVSGAQAMTEAQQTEVHHDDRTDGR
jgi:hypothetical protein